MLLFIYYYYYYYLIFKPQLCDVCRPSAKSKGPRAPAVPSCFRCGEQGHRRRDCPHRLVKEGVNENGMRENEGEGGDSAQASCAHVEMMD